ncbi:MAG: class I SAM-dependent methyltransferase [Candidatus Dactylopiibacterium sp.]|nr:class I SAM-dependent methyltransferase [Candidatus Dactylopiibacterium sp.]
MSSPAAAATILDLYERHAAAWAAARGATLHMEHAWLARFTDGLAAGARVLDLGCGSAEPIAAHLIAQGFALQGVDGSAAMIARCRARFPQHDWLCADMRGLRLARRFDAILAWDSFFHLTHADQRAMFAVFAAHAAPGAALMFTTGPAHGEAPGTLFGEPLYHASLAPAEYRARLRAHGFAELAHVAEDPACGGHTVWLARHAGA